MIRINISLEKLDDFQEYASLRKIRYSYVAVTGRGDHIHVSYELYEDNEAMLIKLMFT